MPTSVPQRAALLTRPRKTLQLTGTVNRLEAQLDGETLIALAWARSALKRHGPDPLASGVIRRALAVYVQHLEAPGTDHGAEATAMRRCCAVLAMDSGDLATVLERLERAPADAPVPPYLDIRRGPHWRAEREAFDASVDALVAANWPLLKRARPT